MGSDFSLLAHSDRIANSGNKAGSTIATWIGHLLYTIGVRQQPTAIWFVSMGAEAVVLGSSAAWFKWVIYGLTHDGGFGKWEGASALERSLTSCQLE